ncbi:MULTISPECIES: four helix bundle protein [Flavobacterium]|uniref:Four helix bundle protein n=1 Tax=Flavobacterium endoglycinae TaxID=2816357 RepID=A0ABX7Q820_9FLAO|nr:four helix bundle protein [Flavobacterium endoglycinae]QSW87170.1 four helix bundle protein [Flavobacterium endoglycinae]
MSLKSFEDLECWKAARELRIFVSQNILSKFPIDEKYALTSQLKRSSRSVSDNIAEGFGRYHYQENIQFCRIARGSLTEALNQVITALDENYIEEDLLRKFRERFERTKAILNGYINYLARTKME